MNTSRICAGSNARIFDSIHRFEVTLHKFVLKSYLSLLKTQYDVPVGNTLSVDFCREQLCAFYHNLKLQTSEMYVACILNQCSPGEYEIIMCKAAMMNHRMHIVYISCETKIDTKRSCEALV